MRLSKKEILINGTILFHGYDFKEKNNDEYILKQIDAIEHNKIGIKKQSDCEKKYKECPCIRDVDCGYLSYKMAKFGFPFISINDNQCFAYMCSDISNEILEKCKIPFEGFLITLSNKIYNDIGIYSIGCSTYQNGLTILIGFNYNNNYNTTSAWFGSGIIGLNVDSKIEYIDPRFNITNFSIPKFLKQAKIAQRILCHVIVAMNEKTLFTYNNCIKKIRVHNIRKKIPVPIKQYAISDPINISLRDHVINYINGHSSRIYKSRWIVRGHWRYQAHGIGHSERRYQFIKPYWKGIDKDTVLLRNYQINDNNNGE